MCVRRGDAVDVLDDECPHEGHPLSMGLVRGNVLTCPWHNWRFDTESGECVVGQESVRRHQTEVLHGEVFVAIDQDEHEAERHGRDLAYALSRRSLEGAVRSALRIARDRGPWSAFASLLRYAATRCRTGPQELFSIARAAWDLYGESALSLSESLALAAVATIDCARDPELVIEPVPSDEHSAEALLLALAEERVDDGCALALGLDASSMVADIGRAWLRPWLSAKLWDGGRLISCVEDALALIAVAQREGDVALARELLAATVRSAGFAVAESDLPGWRTTRQAILDQRSARGDGADELRDEGELTLELLGSEAQALRAVRRALDSGVAARALVRPLVHAAVERVARYDVRWSRRATVHPICALDVGVAVRMTRSMLDASLTGRAAVAPTLMTAGLLGKLRRTTVDAPSSAPDQAESLDALHALVRRGCLRSATMRGEGAPLASALWHLGKSGAAPLHRCIAAARRAFVEDEPHDLARVAQVAALRVGRDGTVKTRPSSIE